MKKQYIFILLFVTHLIMGQTSTGNSTEVGITEGQLSVSLSGGASYSVPIAVPPGINRVVPQIGLVYNSQGGNGQAGYGWNISGLSAITRIPRTKFHDGVVGGVNLDANDRFAFDGQRLILKSGAPYGTAGTIYETESFSNLKITAVGVSPLGTNYGPASFKVEYPDGSVAEYGTSNDSRSITTWGITFWENPQGVRISYSYLLADNNLSIDYIKYGSTGTNTPINQIQFVYAPRKRPEQSYVGGQSILLNTILKEIKTIGNGLGFRNYGLDYDSTSLDYERLISITEKSGDVTKSYNPTVFSYDTTEENIIISPIITNLTLNPLPIFPPGYNIYDSPNENFDNNISGDFGTDGKSSLILFNNDLKNRYSYLFYPDVDSNSNSSIGTRIYVGKFDNIFTVNSLLSGNITSGYKIKQNQAWCITQKDNITDITTFSLYTKNTVNNNPTILEYSFGYNFPRYCWKSPTQGYTNSFSSHKQYLTGDFNGDGISDCIALERGSNTDYSDVKTCNANDIHYDNSSSSRLTAGKVYFVNFDKRVIPNNVIFAGTLDNINGSLDLNVFPTSNQAIVTSGDVNGDGKTDIIVALNGGVDVYSLDINNNIIKTQSNVFPISTDVYRTVIRPQGGLFIDDYNGDGKTDYGPGLLSNGTSFSTVSYAGLASGVPMDYNNDGKTDFFNQVKSKNVYLSTFLGNINKNNLSYSSINYTPSIAADFYNINHFINTTNFKKKNQIGLLDIARRRIYYITINKDFNKDKLIKSVTTGNGVKETITYAPLINGNGVYTATEQIENYPNKDIFNQFGIQVVSKIEKQSASVYKKQLFAYAGATSNSEGLGYFGFRASMRTNWFEEDSQIISYISNFDPNLRGVNVANYTYLGLYAPTIAVNTTAPNIPRTSAITINNTKTATETVQATNSIRFLPGATISPPIGNIFVATITPDYDANGFGETNTVPPSNLISKSLSFYEANLSTSKVYKLQNTQSNNYNILENTSSETNIVYDPDNNPTESISKIRNGVAGEQTTVSTVAYQSPTTSPYAMGRPISKIQTISSSGDSMSTKETYGYGTGTESNLLKKIDKWGNNTSAITEANEYDAFGNITKKTISAAGISDRKTSYKYDSTGRFLEESYDIETLKTVYVYNPEGTLKSQTNPFGLTTSYLYDSWFKKTTTTDYLGKTNTLAYSRQNEKTLISSTGGDDGSYSEELYDDLGRKLRTGIKDFHNNMSYKDFKYDIYDRNFSLSEPHTGSPSLWNTTTYDIYGRPETATDFRNKVISTVYDKLSTTATDSSTGNKKTSTKNAMGNVITMTETPSGGVAGTIKYSYFATGNLKETNYAGTKITLTQDGWGRKTSLVDPSAGNYAYEYNALGEMTKETTPNGITTYDLDDWGKPETKTVSGLNTDSNTVYTYNAVADGKLLIKTQYTDAKDASNWITTDYFYDIKKRLEKTIETTGYGAVFTKTLSYDTYGRVDSETSEATLNGKSSKTKVQNEYKNGFSYKIKDTQNPKTLWETNEVNARGQLTKATLGNGIVILNTYDSSNFGYLTNTKHTLTSTATTVMELTNDFGLQRGNLNWRENGLFGNVRENFTYDNQDRLLSYPNALGTIVSQTYEADGRIKTNTLGTYNYANTSKKYQNTSVTLAPEATGYYANREGIFSESMEDKKGWVIYDPTVYNFDATEKHSGNTSLKIANNSPTAEKVIHSVVWTKIDNTVPTSYTYSAWVKSDAPQAELFLFMKTETETNYFTLVDSKVTNVKNQWTRIEGTFTVPANIKKLNLRLDNNGLGNVWFDDVMIRKTNNAALVNLQVPDATYKDRQLNISYNTFKSPIEISEAGVDKLSFVYNDNNSRSVMFYGSVDDTKAVRPNRKYYSADGTMEIKLNILTGETAFVTYLGGDGYSAPVVYKKTYNTAGTAQEQMLYLHRDYQGSILAITNDIGAVLEKRQFDAWGAIVKVQDGNGNALAGLTILDRGYTGHEHLQSVGLINMNGRIYDSKLHRFLQPDNNIQEPFNTQNYNRYSYVLNNPLKYTDPSGEFWGFFAALLFTSYANGVNQSGGEYNPTKWNSSTWTNVGLNGLSFVASGVATNYTNNYIVNYSKPPELGVSATSNGSGGGNGHPYVSTAGGNIHMPTQHSSLGFNWTYLSEGKPGERFIYDAANTISIFGQYFMGRGVGDGSYRNLDGSSTTTDEGVMAFVNIGSFSTLGIGNGAVSAADGSFYSVAYETKLASNSYPGGSYYSHFKQANTSLNNAMALDRGFSNSMTKLGIEIPQSSTGNIIGKSPNNWVWHHDIDSGIMQLVPKTQHPSVPGGIFWKTMHPNGVGGMSIWGNK